jgi:hypothetical protein
MNISSIGTNVIPGTLTPIGTVKSTSPHGVTAAASLGGIEGVYQHHDFTEEKAEAFERWSAHVVVNRLLNFSADEDCVFVTSVTMVHDPTARPPSALLKPSLL